MDQNTKTINFCLESQRSWVQTACYTRRTYSSGIFFEIPRHCCI